MMSRTNTRLLALVLILLSLAFVAAALAMNGWNWAAIKSDLTKLLLQAGTVTVLGGVAALIVESNKESRQQAASTAALRREFLARFVKAYNDAKRSRRYLQSGSRKLATERTSIMETQLALEAMVREARVLFPRDPAIALRIRCMEQYLNRVLEEAMRGEPGTFLKDFLRSPARGTKFARRFSGSQHAVLERLLDVLTGRRDRPTRRPKKRSPAVRPHDSSHSP